MSLIDDALKRARERENAGGADNPPARKDPWDYAPLPEKRSGSQSRTILAIVLMAGLAVAVGIVLLGRRSGGGPPVSTASAYGSPAAIPTSGAASQSQPLQTVEVAPPPGVRLPRQPAAPVDRTNSVARQPTPSIPIGVSLAGERTFPAIAPTPRPAPAAASAPAAPPGQARPYAPESVPSRTAAGAGTGAAAGNAPAPPRPARFAASSGSSAAIPDPPSVPVVEMSSASGSPRIARTRASAPPAGSASASVPSPPASAAEVPDTGSRSARSDYDAPPVQAPAGSRSALANVAPRNEVVHTSAANLPARSYVGSFVAPNGVKIDLGGIVYSETSPVALVNGRVLPTGGMVEGLMVVSIEENRLELEGEGVHVFLSVK